MMGPSALRRGRKLLSFRRSSLRRRAGVISRSDRGKRCRIGSAHTATALNAPHNSRSERTIQVIIAWNRLRVRQYSAPGGKLIEKGDKVERRGRRTRFLVTKQPVIGIAITCPFTARRCSACLCCRSAGRRCAAEALQRCSRSQFTGRRAEDQREAERGGTPAA